MEYSAVYSGFTQPWFASIHRTRSLQRVFFILKRQMNPSVEGSFAYLNGINVSLPIVCAQVITVFGLSKRGAP